MSSSDCGSAGNQVSTFRRRRLVLVFFFFPLTSAQLLYFFFPRLRVQVCAKMGSGRRQGWDCWPMGVNRVSDCGRWNGGLHWGLDLGIWIGGVGQYGWGSGRGEWPGFSVFFFLYFTKMEKGLTKGLRSRMWIGCEGFQYEIGFR